MTDAATQHGLYELGVALAALASGYALIACVAVLRARHVSSMPLRALPGVSVLKPLCGAERRLYGCLRSFCEQSHAQVQLICGVQDARDTAISVVRRLQREFPQRDIEMVIDPTQHGSSAKVSNLINMMRHARHESLVVSDSDIRVAHGYLAAVVGPLEDPAVGIVTCAYRALPGRRLWSHLGALFVNDWFIPGVRVAALFGSRSFAFGATIALRRQTLERIGGFAAIASQLADDYRLGELTRRAGLRTELADVTVDTFIEERTPAALFAHELRWLRTIRTVQPLGYAFSFVTFGVPVAAIGCALSAGARAALTLFALTLLARTCMHLYTRSRPAEAGARSNIRALAAAITVSRVLRSIGLILLGDTLAFALWCWSFTSRRVRWRQRCYEIAADGSMSPVR